MLYLFFIKNSNRNVIVCASTLTAGNIKKGVKIFNVTGTFTGWVDNSIVMFQNGTLVQNSNLGGTVTYNAGTWWDNGSSWMGTNAGGTWSQGTNIVLKLTTNCNISSSRRMYHGARMQFGPVNTPTFKSFTLTYSWQFKQNWDDKRIMFCWGSEYSLNDYQLHERSTSYGYISSLDGAVASSGSKTVSHNLHNYTINGSTTWYRYVDMKVYCQTPVYDTPNEATITITKITLNKSTV